MADLSLFAAWHDFLPRPVFNALPTWILPIFFVLFWACVVGFGFYLFCQAMSFVAPRIMAIARVTAKEGWSQPLFWVELALGVFLLILFAFIPYNTFGEDIKMLKDSGLTLILVLSIILAVWTASVSIADEIEGRTALTMLSKPISRRQFIFGKFLGVLGPVFVLFVVLGAVFLSTVSYKVVYDARETSSPPPKIHQIEAEIVQVAPGLVLAFMETVMLTGISVAISTRLPMLPNLLICTTVYVLGHLTPLLVQSAIGKIAIVRFIGRFFAVILPQLDYFNMQAAIAMERQIPWDYMAWALAYCVLYTTITLLVALLLFESRDLG